MNEGRTAVLHEERMDLDSFQQTNLPSYQPKFLHYPDCQMPKDGARPRRMLPLEFSG